MIRRLEGKIAIVTGGSSGIGEAISRSFVAEGAAVVIAGRDQDKAEALAEELSAVGYGAFGIGVDVANGQSYCDLVAATIGTFGVPNIIVNNAGVSQRFQIAHEIEEAEYDRLFSVNTKSLYWSAVHGIPPMVANGGGSIVNVCSVSATRPRQGNVWYAGSKAAAVTMTKALALEYAPQGIRVCGVNPGIVDTPLFRNGLEGYSDPAERDAAFDRLSKSFPLGRIAQAKEIADAVLFMASDEASFVTGTVLEVDGGRAI